ncbi:MAG: hypothetical protein ABMB14_19795 [Myxococcota bacterium]
MSGSAWLGWVGWLGLGLGGCGRLADGDYIGEPLFALSGTVYDDGSSHALGTPLRVALFWANDLSRQQEDAVVVSTRFPAEYTLTLYAFPPEETLFTAAWDPDGRYAIGTPLVYADRDADGRWDPDDEEVVGGSLDKVVLFAADGGDLPGPTGETIPLADRAFARVYAATEGSSVCGQATADVLQEPMPRDPTDLQVGTWWTQLGDWDCDGNFDEWQDLCPDPDVLGEWCLEADPGAPCTERCPERTSPTDTTDPTETLVDCDRQYEACIAEGHSEEECASEYQMCTGEA